MYTVKFLLCTYIFIFIILIAVDLVIIMDKYKGNTFNVMSERIFKDHKLFFMKFLSKIVIIASLFVLYKDIPLFVLLLLLL